MFLSLCFDVDIIHYEICYITWYCFLCLICLIYTKPYRYSMWFQVRTRIQEKTNLSKLLTDTLYSQQRTYTYKHRDIKTKIPSPARLISIAHRSHVLSSIVITHFLSANLYVQYFPDNFIEVSHYTKTYIQQNMNIVAKISISTFGKLSTHRTKILVIKWPQKCYSIL